MIMSCHESLLCTVLLRTQHDRTRDAMGCGLWGMRIREIGNNFEMASYSGVPAVTVKTKDRFRRPLRCGCAAGCTGHCVPCVAHAAPKLRSENSNLVKHGSSWTAPTISGPRPCRRAVCNGLDAAHGCRVLSMGRAALAVERHGRRRCCGVQPRAQTASAFAF